MALWLGALALVALAIARGAKQLVPATRGTAAPFLTLAGIILAAALADRLGMFRLLARLLVPEEASRFARVAAVLAFTALLSGLVNLDVAVVVAMPVALRAAQGNDLPTGWLAAAVATTANASSFLLPTSNITTMLVLGHASLSTGEYVGASWLPWLLVTALTVGGLAMVLDRAGHDRALPVTTGPSFRTVLDLAPMFLAASAIRALLAGGIVLHGTFTEQLASVSGLAVAVNNLPAAAAVRAVGAPGSWAAILALAIGPNLLITGSVATVICRRIARDGGAGLMAWRFSAIGLALVPAQLAAATLGLHIVGALR